MRRRGVIACAVVFGCTPNVPLELPTPTPSEQTLVLAIDNLGEREDVAEAFDLRDGPPSFGFRTDDDVALSVGLFERSLEELGIEAGGLSLQLDGEALPNGRFFWANVEGGTVRPWMESELSTGLITKVNIPIAKTACLVLERGEPQPELPFASGLIVPAVIDVDTTLLVTGPEGLHEVRRGGTPTRIDFTDGGPASEHVWSVRGDEFWTVDRTQRLSRINRATDGTYSYRDIIPSATSTIGRILEVSGGTDEGQTEIFMITADHNLLWTKEDMSGWLVRPFDAPSTVPENDEIDVAWFGPNQVVVANHTNAPLLMTAQTDRIDARTLNLTGRVDARITAAVYQPDFGTMAAGNNIFSAFFDVTEDTLVVRQFRRLRHPVRDLLRITDDDMMFLTDGAFLGFDQNQGDGEEICDTTMGVSAPNVRFLRRVAESEVFVVQQRSTNHAPRIHYFTWSRP